MWETAGIPHEYNSISKKIPIDCKLRSRGEETMTDTNRYSNYLAIREIDNCSLLFSIARACLFILADLQTKILSCYSHQVYRNFSMTFMISGRHVKRIQTNNKTKDTADAFDFCFHFDHILFVYFCSLQTIKSDKTHIIFIRKLIVIWYGAI